MQNMDNSSTLQKSVPAFGRFRGCRRLAYNSCVTAVLLCLLSLYTVHRFVLPSWQEYESNQRCLNEVSQLFAAPIINGSTRQELVQQFIRVYDVDFNVGQTRDAGALADSWVNCQQVHPDQPPELGAILKWLSTAPITKAINALSGNKPGNILNGHSAKFIFHLEGQYKAMFKIKRYKRNEIVGDLSKMSLKGERHNGEIASYHLQRILGFNRAPIAVGRKVDIMREIVEVGENDVKKHFSMKDGKMCIKQIRTNGVLPGQITKRRSYMCSDDGAFEGVMMLWLPRPLEIQAFESPIKHHTEGTFLKDGLIYPLDNNENKLLDYVDTLLFDYLIQNGDRYTFFFEPSNYSSILLLDNGKSFGDPFQDFKKMLDVFAGRCQIRLSTYTRFTQLSDGVLSEVLRQILSRDPIAPVLWDPHFKALDRRLVDILDVINKCIETHGTDYVMIK